jgi:hypothetical protein
MRRPWSSADAGSPSEHGDGKGVTRTQQRMGERELPTPPCGPHQHRLVWASSEPGNPATMRPNGSHPNGGGRPDRPSEPRRATRAAKTVRAAPMQRCPIRYFVEERFTHTTWRPIVRVCSDWRLTPWPGRPKMLSVGARDGKGEYAITQSVCSADRQAGMCWKVPPDIGAGRDGDIAPYVMAETRRRRSWGFGSTWLCTSLIRIAAPWECPMSAMAACRCSGRGSRANRRRL